MAQERPELLVPVELERFPAALACTATAPATNVVHIAARAVKRPLPDATRTHDRRLIERLGMGTMSSSRKRLSALAANSATQTAATAAPMNDGLGAWR